MAFLTVYFYSPLLILLVVSLDHSIHGKRNPFYPFILLSDSFILSFTPNEIFHHLIHLSLPIWYSQSMEMIEWPLIYPLYFLYLMQVICGVGRENIESWGRKKRSVHTYEMDDEMTLSREILVLDFNDPADASRSTMDPFEVDEVNHRNSQLPSEVAAARCGSKNTVVALSILSGLLVVIYVCTVAYFTAHRKSSSSSSSSSSSAASIMHASHHHHMPGATKQSSMPAFR